MEKEREALRKLHKKKHAELILKVRLAECGSAKNLLSESPSTDFLKL